MSVRTRPGAGPRTQDPEPDQERRDHETASPVAGRASAPAPGARDTELPGSYPLHFTGTPEGHDTRPAPPAPVCDR